MGAGQNLTVDLPVQAMGRISGTVTDADGRAVSGANILLLTREYFLGALRYVQAYRETLDWMYSDPAALKAYAEWVNVPETLAREVRDQFYPKENLRLERLSGLDAAMADAVSLKFLPAPLTQPQQEELFKYYARGVK